MRHHFLSFVCVLSFISIAGSVSTRGDEPATETLPGPLHGEMRVHLKGTLQVATKLKAGADPNSRPQDEGAWELVNASVEAGGTVVEIDWNASPAIRDELLWWGNPRHGDLRVVQAEVTGRLVFKRLGDIGGTGLIISSGLLDKEVPRPVVIVETLHVQLVGPEGFPRGPQFDRKPVKVTKGRHNKAVNPSDGSGDLE